MPEKCEKKLCNVEDYGCVCKELKFATAEDVIQPVGGVILEERDPNDYILGANDPKKLGQVLVEDGHWARYMTPVIEIQRVRDGDTYCCTAFSDNEIDEAIHIRKYGSEINISDMFVGVGSGNRRGVGNSMKAPAEFKRLSGFALESEYPYSREMTLDQFYAPIPQIVYDKAKNSLTIYKTGYLSLIGVGQDSVLEALKVSPIKIAIEGNYVFDAKNRLRSTGSGYTHAVVLFDYVLDENGNVEEYWIRCSETNQLLRMRADYAFVSPLIKFLEKKTMKMYKKNGQAGIGFVNELKDGLILWTDGEDNLGRPVIGGSLFKTMGLLYSLAEPCEEWPLPIVGYAQVKPQP